MASIPEYYDSCEDTLYKKNGVQKQVLYLLMEYVDGVTLFDFFIKMNSQDDQYLRYIFRKVAMCLH